MKQHPPGLHENNLSLKNAKTMYSKDFELKKNSLSLCESLTVEMGLQRFYPHKLHLDLHLISCTFGFVSRDLAKKDRNGASDPFVRVRYNGKTYESAVRTYLCKILICSATQLDLTVCY